MRHAAVTSTTASGHRPRAAAVTVAAAMTTLNGVAAAQQETDEESLKNRRQRQLENDMETMRHNAAATNWTHRESHNQSQSQSQSPGRSQLYMQQQQLVDGDKGLSSGGSHINGSSGLAAMLAIPKRERINHATMTTPPTSAATTMTTKLGNTVLLPSTLLTSSSASVASKSNGGSSATASLLLNGSDVTKKGSTSTIWTSEESILRSVGAVDEDNNSTSSSACEEASGVLSSGKSGISLDSSGLDNDNNESGIGTATPPKDISYWKSQQNDNESISSLDALRKMKFQKSSSVASSDDPDLLEVLSLCDEPHGVDEDIALNGGDESHDDNNDDQPQQHHQRQPHQRPPTGGIAADKLKNSKLLHLQQQQLLRAARQRHRQPAEHAHQRTRQDDNDNVDCNDVLELTATEAGDDGVVDVADLADEYDEGHDEFEVGPYCDCECNDGDASSASGSAGGGSRSGSTSANDTLSSNSVVLRRKLSAATTPIMMPYAGGAASGGGRAQKCRSHSLDTSSMPAVYYQYSPLQHQHPQQHHPLTRKLHQHLHGRGHGRERGQLSLALRQEPFQCLLSPSNFADLPSPSSASLHSGHESLGIQELTTKSNSAPLLLKQEKTRRDDFAGQKLTLRYSRSQSDRYLAEIEAVEACKWLRAAGFPQYAQMYEDHQFPLDLTNVAKDHTNLENDQLQSLYRRLCILNRCANMRLDQSHKAQTPQKEDSDDENCALSENWTFQPHIRRWSRIGEMGLELPPAGKLNIEKTESSSKESSPDRFEDDNYDVSGEGGGGGLSLTLPGNSTDSTLNDTADSSAVRLRRTGSERFKDGAKAFLRRVESIKSRRRKRQNREGIVISGPQALDLSQLGQRGSLRKPDAVYSTPPSPSAVSPMHTFPKGPMFGNELKVPSQSETFLSPNRASPKRTPTTPRSMRASPLHFFSNPMPHLKEGKSDDSSSYYSDSQESSAGGKLTLRKPSKTRRFLQRTGKVDDIGAHSDSECHHGRKLLIKDANSNTTEIKVKKLTRGGSLNLGKDPKKREGFRSASFRSRSTSRKETKTEETENVKRSAPVVRWHSFQMEERPHMIFRKCFSQKVDSHQKDNGIPFAAMSAGQLHILRKLALVILTGYMERYCPTHRSGWNWELPKFIKKIKMPDYKDKKVFGVPLLLVLQRTGQTMPIVIRAAFRWLQVRALDQIGLFRKSGVKSRIIKLKSEVEQLDSTALCMEVYDTQQAYDVADMLKQYFRDLPESLLTTKMSETFAAIFQHLPKDVRLEAVQSAVLLLPDENREILYALLEFLTLVAANAEQNQMTANNLAVCLAPSLFHSSISTGAASVSASPRRRKGAGVPDDKELQEAKASHECLSFMIENYKQIFTASKEKISKCNFGYMEESKPVPLEALGMQFHNWRGYLYECTKATIKEGREKTRGWFTISSQNDSNVDIAYKKVGDGHPLRLWRCTTEVEGPPKEVLDYIIKQRASWDSNLLESQTVKKLDESTEIFQYAIDGQFTTDFCVLRSWQTTNLPRGACVIVETSIDDSKAKPMFGAIRGVVLASRYLIEPCGSGRSRVMHLTRVDVKGRTPEWYNKSYGQICSLYLSKIRLAFKHVAEGPESKV
uniref:StAR-related lipid transfer protein 13 n=2 Tax=Ceratitis capitata TaxID=7213 RepID=W8AR19_CERCA